MTAPELLEADVQSYSVTPKWKPVQNADYYEIVFNGQTYTTIRHNSLLFDDLQPATTMISRCVQSIAMVQASGRRCTWKTAVNPLEYAIQGLTATSTARDMEGSKSIDSLTSVRLATSGTPIIIRGGAIRLHCRPPQHQHPRQTAVCATCKWR